MPLDLACNETQRILVTVTPTKPNGSPGSIEGPVRVTVESGGAAITMVDDLNFYVRAAGQAGPSSILVQADADLGAGEVLIQDTIALNVTAELASIFGLSAGTPETDPE